MVKFSEVQKKWVDEFLGTQSGQGVSSFRSDEQRSARTTNVILVDDLPPAPGVDLPTIEGMVEVIDLDRATQYKMHRDDIKKSPDYIDRYKVIHARPDWLTLTITTIELYYASGKTFRLEWDSVKYGFGQLAYLYGRKEGIYYPRDRDGNVLFDLNNTPAVVVAVEKFNEEIARRKQEREEMAWLVYTFAGAVSALGGAAGGGGGHAPVGGGGRTRPRTGGGRRGGGSTKPTGGGSSNPAGRSTGGGGGKPTGGGGGGRGGGTPPKGPTPYPSRRPPSPDALPPKPLPDADMRRGSIQASRDIKRSHTDPKGVWDQSAFKKNPKLKSSLDDFENPKNPKGKSVKNLDVRNKRPEQLHQELQATGFEHHREPLVAFEAKGVKHYRLRKSRMENGQRVTTTTNKDDPDVVPHDIYKHPDGGLVRVKPEGDPNGRRPRPQVSKSVLHDPNAGTAFDNEMFKVTNDGHPVPKLPTADAGMKQAPRGSTGGNESAGYVDTVMTEAHPDLNYE